MTRQLPLFRHHHEPDDTALDPINTVLDRIEADARAVVDAGGEVALRLRLARILFADAVGAGPFPQPLPALAVPLPVRPTDEAPPRPRTRRRAAP